MNLQTSNQKTYLVTGGSGYVGSLITNSLLQDGHKVINIDIQDCALKKHNLISYKIDITDSQALKFIFQENTDISCIFHCAAQLLYNKKNRDFFYKTNVNATQNLVDLAVKYNVKNFIYISSNCIYGKINRMGIKENEVLKPFEEYGQTKLMAENILWEYKNKLNIIIFRPPTILGKGRLGILSIVFDFILENKKLWLVGKGYNRYQFVSGDDLVKACQLAKDVKFSDIFNIGTENISSLKEIFINLIKETNSKTKIYHLPAFLIIPFMKLFYKLGLSPLGPYQYNMITNSYSGCIDKIKNSLGWRPSLDNTAILKENFSYYVNNYKEIHANQRLVGHKKPGRAGIILILKWLS